MNFLELINKCLLELNYREVNSFAELVKNDHKKIITILNIINQEICNSYNWNFLLRKTSVTIPVNATEVENNIKGRILHLFIDGKKYQYTDDIEPFITSSAKDCTYSVFNNKFLFPKSDKVRSANVIYYTKNCASNANDEEKELMSDPTDYSLLPDPFAQQLLVYGTCMRLKANPTYIRFNYWLSMYKEALANLRAKTSVDAQNSPHIRLLRE